MKYLAREARRSPVDEPLFPVWRFATGRHFEDVAEVYRENPSHPALSSEGGRTFNSSPDDQRDRLEAHLDPELHGTRTVRVYGMQERASIKAIDL